MNVAVPLLIVAFASTISAMNEHVQIPRLRSGTNSHWVFLTLLSAALLFGESDGLALGAADGKMLGRLVGRGGPIDEPPPPPLHATKISEVRTAPIEAIMKPACINLVTALKKLEDNM